jgi:hypothetical protein
VSEERAMSGPTKVVMDYHHEPEGWWADSEDLPGFTAAGATRLPQIYGEADGSS